MPKAILYSGTIYQSGSTKDLFQVTASSGGRPVGSISASFSILNTGSYRMGGSIGTSSFSGVSGSISGSLYIVPTVDTRLFTTGGFIITPNTSSTDSLFIYTFSDMFTKTLGDNIIPSGALSIEIGINY